VLGSHLHADWCAAMLPYEELQAIFLSLIGGARYGIKIRLPHALVMTLLFRRDLSAQKKLQSILRLAVEHATNLAAFACIYKSTLALLKWASRCFLKHPSNLYNYEGFLRYYGRVLLSMIGKRKHACVL
jgi:hypothetical protein